MVRSGVLSYMTLRTGQNVAWFRGIALAVGLVAAAGSAQGQERITLAGRKVAVWRPAETTRQPVIFFSHGFSGCATQSRFLMEALAANGYWVFAMDHKDARCGGARGGFPRAAPFIKPETWTDKSFDDRRDDIRAVRAALENSADYEGRLDWSRVGLVGHSLGGYTVLGLVGAWTSWRMPGIKAVLALSPYAQPFIAHSTLGGLRAPVMYQGGTLDVGITPWIKKNSGGLRRHASAPLLRRVRRDTAILPGPISPRPITSRSSTTRWRSSITTCAGCRPRRC